MKLPLLLLMLLFGCGVNGQNKPIKGTIYFHVDRTWEWDKYGLIDTAVRINDSALVKVDDVWYFVGVFTNGIKISWFQPFKKRYRKKYGLWTSDIYHYDYRPNYFKKWIRSGRITKDLLKPVNLNQ